MPLFVDLTHVHRPTTGLERIALELFSPEALRGFNPEYFHASSVIDMTLKQWIDMPRKALKHRNSLFLCPGFPPSIALQKTGARIIPYVHDLFLATRTNLSLKASLYMRPSFNSMLKLCRHFFVNSEKTASELAERVQPNSCIHLYRPQIRNVFNIAETPCSLPGQEKIFIAMGTVEPRKNYLFAADLMEELNSRGFGARLKIIGRPGWGPDVNLLRTRKYVDLLGYIPDHQVAEIIATGDALLSTSFDEGLGLPLLELQYSMLPTFAADIPAYRESLSGCACFLPGLDVRSSADIIIHFYMQRNWRALSKTRAIKVLDRNAVLAQRDKERLFEVMSACLSG